MGGVVTRMRREDWKGASLPPDQLCIPKYDELVRQGLTPQAAMEAALTGFEGTNGQQPLAQQLKQWSPTELRASPAPRKYLLTDARSGRGVVAAGIVGLLAAKGGTGKTQLLMQLAIAVATGGTWLGAGVGWKAEQGRVLLVLAEEDLEEAHRRLHQALQATHTFSDDELAFVEHGIVTLAMRGQSVDLVRADAPAGVLPETVRAGEVRGLLELAARSGDPFSLVILDPLSRFVTADTEKDNFAATRFVQVVETLTSKWCGSPTALLSHHRRKQGKDDAADSSDPIRGAVGLVDGVRWAALLEPMKRAEDAPELVKLQVVKTNYAMAPEPVTLCRPKEEHGYVRVATQDEWVKYARAMGWKEADKAEDLQSRVLEAVKNRPGSGSELARRLSARKESVLTAIEQLIDSKKLRREGNLLFLRGQLQAVPAVPGSSEEPGQGAGSPVPFLKEGRELEPGPAALPLGLRAPEPEPPESEDS